jgi:hypothetical protein
MANKFSFDNESKKRNFTMKPIFIFSQPKSGSTLLQRILGASRAISTVTEPWILLPFIYTLRSYGVESEYWHGHAVRAIEDFNQELPNGKEDYKYELRKFILNLYKKASSAESLYFLDKTPRYHLICNEIIDLFPDGKFIFLWRNPLAVASSIIQRWCYGKWKATLFYIDLYEGINQLLNGYIANKPQILSVKYEDLVQNPSLEVQKICDYLGVHYEDQMINSFYHTPLKGCMTEWKGSIIYKNKLSTKSLHLWQNTFNNPYRRYWAIKYLNWIGKERLKTMGYDYSLLKNSLQNDKTISLNSLFPDVMYSVFYKLKILLYPLKSRYNNSFKFPYM